MFRRLLPHETDFFELFDRHVAVTVEGAHQLKLLVQSPDNHGANARRITELESEADHITHQCVEALHKTFITPFDRNDMHTMISRLDDVLDLIEAAAERIALYRITEMTRELQELADVLYRSTRVVEQAVHGLRDMRGAAAIREHCVDINRLENEADAILRRAIADLFQNEKDPIIVLKYKEIYETLEQGTDCCEDVAHIIEGVTLEHE